MFKRLLTRLLGGGNVDAPSGSRASRPLNQIFEMIEKRAQPCIRLTHDKGSTSALSKIGGEPNMSGRFQWPRWNDRPLAFLAQLDLVEVQATMPIEWLPGVGRLLFFYDAEQEHWGFDPKDRGSWVVLFDPEKDPAETVSAPTDLPSHGRFKELKMSLGRSQSYPSLDRLHSVLSDIADDDWDAIDERFAPSQPIHQIEGLPAPIQSDNMELECQLASNGVYVGTPDGYLSEEAKSLAPGKDAWRLLLQIDSDDEADAMWGDSGMLYFWIRREDAERRDFSKTWMILQCC